MSHESYGGRVELGSEDALDSLWSVTDGPHPDSLLRVAVGGSSHCRSSFAQPETGPCLDSGLNHSLLRTPEQLNFRA